MIQGPKLFKYFLITLAAAFGVTVILGTLAFSLAFNETTHTLDSDSAYTVAFIAFTSATFIGIAVLSILERKSCVEKNTESMKFSLISALVASSAFLAFFVSDILNIASADTTYAPIETARAVFSLFACAYLATEAMPLFSKEVRIRIPEFVKAFLYFASIIWAILGIFSIYFTSNESLLSTSILFDAKILTYVATALFLVFEAERALSIPKPGALIGSALTVSLLSLSFSASCLISIAFGAMDTASSGFSVLDHVSAVCLGVFTLSKVCSALTAEAPSTEEQN